MADDFDCYELLGVSRDANDDQIKKAYRKAALKWHPDKNPDNKDEAERKFKQVAEAYQVLSDPNQRALYDRGGLQAVRGGPSSGRGARSNMNHADAFNIFESFFGGRDPFAEFDEIFSRAGPMGPGRPMGMRGRSHTAGPGMGGMFGGRSMFDDPFFQSSFNSSFDFPSGGGGSSTVFTSSSTSGSGRGGGGVVSSSTTTTTRVVNGKRVTVTEKKVQKADGTVEVTKTESEGDAGSGQGSGGSLRISGSFSGFGGGGRRATAHGRLGF